MTKNEVHRKLHWASVRWPERTVCGASVRTVLLTTDKAAVTCATCHKLLRGYNGENP